MFFRVFREYGLRLAPRENQAFLLIAEDSVSPRTGKGPAARMTLLPPRFPCNAPLRLRKRRLAAADRAFSSTESLVDVVLRVTFNRHKFGHAAVGDSHSQYFD
jgi:hypothetical protein